MGNLYKILQLQFYFFLLVIGVAGYFTYQYTTDIVTAKKAIHEHTRLLNLLLELKISVNNKQTLQELQKLRAYIIQPERAEYISNYIQAFNSNNKSMIDKRFNELLYYETHFLSLNETIIEEKTQQVFAIVFGAILLQALNAWMYLRMIKKQVLSPILQLTQKINDFMDGSYTYRFTTPIDNEVGNLEASFKLMAEEVLKHIEELKALDHAKSEFMNIVSHELRTPMTSIKGSLGLIAGGRMGELPEKVKKLIHIAEVESNRLIRLINDFLDLAKIEAKSYSLEKRWINIDKIITSAVDSLKGLQEKVNVGLEVLSVPSVEVFVDADKVQQILVNLLSNAMKFTAENTTVYVQANIFEGKVFVRVRDQGPGISEENQQKIFQKFRQVTTVDRPLVKGTGLGLSIAKALVEAHDGKIGIASKLGEGSEFYFTIIEYRNMESNKEKSAA